MRFVSRDLVDQSDPCWGMEGLEGFEMNFTVSAGVFSTA